MAEPWTKNAAGVKDGASMYRTIKGVRWDWWPTGNLDALRSAGIRCRRSGGEVFVHPDDDKRAWELTYNAAANASAESK